MIEKKILQKQKQMIDLIACFSIFLGTKTHTHFIRNDNECQQLLKIKNNAL